ncbi:GFA family protein [Sphingomonas sp. GB1N7]|uniref:GFA family protein n=1 Tax=Parasphingomonas caseinilytica TaxID=3096158 RepID=UPI002FC6381C
MTITGGCRCGAVRYTAEGQPDHNALCLCEQCRRSAGAPMVGWALFAADAVTITGTPVSYNSSGDAERQFCGTCGTGLFYLSETVFPGKIDIQTGSFDNPDALAPQAVIQMADAPRWMAGLEALPKFERYPGA